MMMPLVLFSTLMLSAVLLTISSEGKKALAWVARSRRGRVALAMEGLAQFGAGWNLQLPCTSHPNCSFYISAFLLIAHSLVSTLALY